MNYWKFNMCSCFNDEFMIMITDFLIRSSILYTYGFHKIFMTHDTVKCKSSINKRLKINEKPTTCNNSPFFFY